MREFGRSEFQQEADKERKKKILIIGMGVCVVLIIFLAFMVIYYKAMDAKTFKLYIDDTQVACSTDFYITDQSGNMYVKAKELAPLIGWTYQNGEYGTFTEDTNSGYFQNDYEIASFVAGSNILNKYIQVSNNVTSNKDKAEKDKGMVVFDTVTENGTLATAELDLPIVSSNNQIYIPLSCIPDICSSTANYQKNRMHIYTQNYLISAAQSVAAQRGYTNLSGYYENIRTLAYGMCVVENNGLYGVVALNSGEQVLGFKYSDIVFQQTVMEFFVKAKDNDGNETVGVVNYKGDSIISPKSYDDISILSDALGLYLVEKDGNYGVLNRQGDVVVHAEYDSIGLPEDAISAYGIAYDENKYVLFDNTMIIEKDGLYGLCTVDGKLTQKPAFSSIGYDTVKDANSLKDSESVLTIEAKDVEMSDGTQRTVQGIVVQFVDSSGTALYGLYDTVSQKLILPTSYSRIYSMTRSGQKTYYIEWNGAPYEFVETIATNPGIF